MKRSGAGGRLADLDDARILIVRNDGLGDFLLTLPLVASLRSQAPGAHIEVLMERSLESLLPLLPDLSGAIPDDGVLLKRHRERHGEAERAERAAALLERVRGGNFDLAILPYAEAASAALVSRAGIPLRLGSLRRSFFWRFNMFNGESRKGSAKSEYELNLSYLACLGLEPVFRFPAYRPGPPEAGEEGDYVVIHPYKRSGTALSWPMENFLAVARDFIRAGTGVVVVGDGADEPMLRESFKALTEARIETGLPLAGLAALIAGARLFMGNSSGPLHLAALGRVPHVGFYPRNRVSSPARWRTLPWPEAPADPESYLLAPELPRQCVVCDLDKCSYFNCLESIRPERVSNALAAWGLESLIATEPPRL